MPGPAPAARENRPVRTTLRRLLGLGILAGMGYALFRALSARAASTPTTWEAQPFPFPPRPVIDESPSPWVEAADSGACPVHHPVKAKLTSGIFHLPGGANYARTQADRCYLSADAAEADGLRAAKR
jgi:hypothetical protein